MLLVDGDLQVVNEMIAFREVIMYVLLTEIKLGRKDKT